MTFIEVLTVLSIIAVIFIEHKKPLEAMLFVLLLIIFPIGGQVFYIIFGSTIWIKLVYAVRSRKLKDEFYSGIKSFADLQSEDDFAAVLNNAQQSTVEFNKNYCNSHVAMNNQTEIITNGKDKYKRMFADIKNSKTSVHVLYYGYHNDSVGRELTALLTERAKAGVKVRVLYDGIGSLFTRRRMFRKLMQAGGRAKRIKSLLTHFRNHRKIVVIDGKTAYMGGMNIGEKYLSMLKHKSPWRDTQLRITGDAVYSLQYFFLYDWLFANRFHGIKNEELPSLFPPHEINNLQPCQIIGSGVENDNENINMTYLHMISAASKRIILQSPYFVPNRSLFNLLKVKAASGVEVILMLPGQKSNFFLEPASRYYIAELIECGARVYYYDGYVHAKTMTIDESITCIGTVNIDVRSMEIDDEVCAIYCDESFAKRHIAVIDEDMLRCKEMDYDAFRKRKTLARINERFYSLFSPLL